MMISIRNLKKLRLINLKQMNLDKNKRKWKMPISRLSIWSCKSVICRNKLSLCLKKLPKSKMPKTSTRSCKMKSQNLCCSPTNSKSHRRSTMGCKWQINSCKVTWKRLHLQTRRLLMNSQLQSEPTRRFSKNLTLLKSRSKPFRLISSKHRME